MLDERLDPDTRLALARTGVDWGNAYAGPAGGGAARAYPAEVARQIGMPALEPVGLATLASPQEPMRRSPAHASELISEVLSGEWLTVLAEEGDWRLVAGEDLYVGWVHAWTLRAQQPEHRVVQQAQFMGRYAHPRGTLWTSDNWAASLLGLGMPLLCPEEGPRTRGTRVLIALAHGPTGWLDEDALLAPAARADVGETLRLALGLLGTPYRWGGRGVGGLDCSGFVQLVFLLAGFDLPRDTRQQVGRGTTVELEEPAWRAGDLLFFGDPVDHVGIYDGRSGLVHCSGLVRRQSVGEIPHLMRRLSQARRMGDGDVVTTRTLWRHPPAALSAP